MSVFGGGLILALWAAAAVCEPTLDAHSRGLGDVLHWASEALASAAEGPAHPTEVITLDRDEELSLSQAYVKACIEERYLPWVSVHAKLHSSGCCDTRDPDFIDTESNSGSYMLSFRNGNVVLTKELFLLFQGDDEDEAHARDMVKKFEGVAKHVFAQHGVTFEPRFHFIGAPANKVSLRWASHMFLHDVAVVYTETPRGWIRPSSSQWMFPTWQPDRVALGATLHEFSHTIGLPDSYSDNVNCRERQLLEPGHVVTSSSGSLTYDENTGEVLNFYAAKQIIALLEPLCG